ncbi:hypothetical protein [Leifsonia sp. 22587]|uniref:hypothetical protein n=1 Tax=Leifsonia sp. 22587 TaxID=3453946 RepID=UPI003F862094
MDDDRQPRPPEHPELTPEELAEQAGTVEDPVGAPPRNPDFPDPDPGWKPDPGRAREWEELARSISKEHRPRREDVYPYLLIRAMSPGDRGQRPLWPPTVCWESPDILLLDAAYAGPFDPSRLEATAQAGRSYRVFVRVWNLGLLPAVGVHVRVWVVEPGFIGAGNASDPYYEQHFVGGRMVDKLDDRTRPGSVAVVELDAPWTVGEGAFGHWCMIASATCPADDYQGPLLVNENRHIGQRNLDILAPDADLQPLLMGLGGLVPDGATLEVTHGGTAVLPLLQGFLPPDDAAGIEAPDVKEVRAGVDLGGTAHLLTAFREDGRTTIVRSRALLQRLGDRSGELAAMLARPGGARQLIEKLGPDRVGEAGMQTDAPLDKALPEAFTRLLDLRRLEAESVARGLGGPGGAWHLLRFTLTSERREFVGGYSVALH